MHIAISVLLVAVVPFFSWGDSQQPSSGSGPAIVIDVSSHQGSIEWKRVAKSGVRGVYHKLSEGQDFLDPTWSSERKRAIQDAGLLYGFYHFVRPKKRPAKKEARWFVSQARAAGGWGKIMPALDIETTELPPRATGNYLADFINAMRSLGVGKMTLYASPSWWQNRVALTPRLQSALRGIRPWIAHWGVARPDPLVGLGRYVLHQYTATGKVPGIQGNVDINRAPELSRILRG